MGRQSLVELGSYFLHSVQAASWNPWEVVMLVVVADIPGHAVQRSVVRIRFLILAEHVVLSNEMTCERKAEEGYSVLYMWSQE